MSRTRSTVATTISIITPTPSPRALLGAVLLLGLEPSLIVRLLSGMSLVCPSQQAKPQCNPQILDTLHLLCRRLVWYSMMPSFNNGLKQALVAVLGIVTLLATVVCLDYDGVGLCSHIAGPPDVAVESSRNMA